MKYVIPSYQRADILKTKTLCFLEKQGVSPEDVYIFIREDDPQAEDYASLAHPTTRYNIITLIDVVGIGMTHNAITNHFAKDEWICELDDDVAFVINNNRDIVSNFPEIVQQMIDRMNTDGISYGGFYQCTNPMFMSGNKEFTTDLRYMLGLMRIRKIDPLIKLETNYAEDFENAILHYLKDGAILKNNWIAGSTKNYNDGGCDGDGRNVETERLDKEFLADKYPHCCTLFQRKNGRWDLRLKKNPIISSSPNLS